MPFATNVKGIFENISKTSFVAVNVDGWKKVRYGGVLSRQPEKVPKRAAIVAVNAAGNKKLRYRSPPFLGGQRYTLACGAHSAPWKTRKMNREKASFFPWHFSSFSFTQELAWWHCPTSRK